SDIRDMFLFKEGQIARTDLLSEADKQLNEALAGRGFPRASVSVSMVATSMPYSKDLVIKVDEGQPLLIKRIRINGESEEEIRKVMRIIEGDVYDQRVVKKDLEKIRDYYKGLRYLNPAVSYRFENEALMLDVGKGKKLEINFQGNEVFSLRRLMKEMPFFDSGAVRDDLIEDAARKITSLYYAKGYASAQVAQVMSEEGDTVMLRFYVFEGEQITVSDIKLPGVTLNEKNLKDVLPMKEGENYNPDMLYQDIAVIREFYVALGYLAVDVETPSVNVDKDKAVITISVKEGPKTLISKLEITGAGAVPADEVLRVLRLKEGHPYNEVDIADGRSRVIDMYFEKGFIDIVINTKVDFAGENALVTYDIHEGEKTFFGKTIITGNTKTKARVISREFLHQESAPFSYSILSKERQKLYRLGLFTEIRMEALDPHDHKRDIKLEVEEGNAGSVEFGVGYSNYEKFTGFVDVGYKNLFGMNRQASLRVGYNSIEKLYSINYYDPWLLDMPLPFKGVVYRTERDEKNIDTKVVMYKYRKHGVSLGIEKPLTDELKGELYYDYVLSKTFEVQPDIILTDKDVGNLGISSVRPGIIYDTRDNPFQPRKGILAGLTVEVASSVLLSETNFVKAVFNGSAYQEISRPLVAAAAFRLGMARCWGGDSSILPLVERFFLGGRNTVRGYAHDTLGPKGINGNPTGGNAFFETNLELRAFLGKGIGVVTFLDSGNVWQRVGDIDWSLKHAVGMGLRYDTPVGPFRLDYGYKLKKEEGLSRGELIFSIGQAF
ncbi:MAG TPA: outer membrane protein assembly factor BamA, partial [Thermodesulfovibrionales bacterium]|nr:outer membrane protein assembly factor BamA [Thermodesulfovibrionales bacterium]